MDLSYYESDYIEFHYYNYIARAQSSMLAMNIELVLARIIHIIARLTRRVASETRVLALRAETRLRRIASETRIFRVKDL